jgi:predicted PurR-regulated permease PerM
MGDQPERPVTNSYLSRREFIRRVWIVISCLLGTAIVLLLAWFGADILLLLFTGILLAIFLRTLSNWVQAQTKLGKMPSLILVIIGLVVLLGGAGWLMAAPISDQFNELSTQIPTAVDKIRHYLQQYPWGQKLLEPIKSDDILPRAKTILGEARGIFSITFSAITGFFLIIFIGLYLAMNARFHIDGLIKLFPMDKRGRAREVLGDVGLLLQRWIVGQLVSMTIIGLVTGTGLYFVGVPLAGILGFLTGFLDFIPLVGPFIAGTISVLLAFVISPTKALYVLIIFVGMQFLESHLLIPIVQKRAAELPPVLTLIAMVLFGSLFGFMGVLLATPMLAVIMVLVRKLYIEDVLGDKEPAIAPATPSPPTSPPPESKPQ